MGDFLCKIWNFLSNLFSGILDLIIGIIKTIADVIVDVIDAVADAVFGNGSLLFLALAALAVYFVVNKEDEPKKLDDAYPGRY